MERANASAGTPAACYTAWVELGPWVAAAGTPTKSSQVTVKENERADGASRSTLKTGNLTRLSFFSYFLGAITSARANLNATLSAHRLFNVVFAESLCPLGAIASIPV